MEVVAEGLDSVDCPVCLIVGGVFGRRAEGRHHREGRPSDGRWSASPPPREPDGAALGLTEADVSDSGRLRVARTGGLTLPHPEPVDAQGGSRWSTLRPARRAFYTDCAGNRLKRTNDLVFDSQAASTSTDNGTVRGRSTDSESCTTPGPTARRSSSVAFPPYGDAQWRRAPPRMKTSSTLRNHDLSGLAQHQ